MNPINYLKSILAVAVLAGAALMFRDQLFLPASRRTTVNPTLSDSSFGWKLPLAIYQPGVGQVRESSAYSDIRDPGGIPRGLPVRLKIPIIGVDTAVEDAYITPDGRMDVPAGSVNVAWYALGPRPGQIGSAVIGGHYGIDNGIPRVFYNLDKIKVGDKAYVLDDNGNTLAFQVTSIRLFGRNDDSTPVFISTDGKARLNIITCEGIWNRIDDSYPERRVVFAEAITETQAGVTPAPLITPKLPATAETPTITTLATTPSSEEVTGITITPLQMIISSIIIVTLLFITAKFIKQ